MSLPKIRRPSDVYFSVRLLDQDGVPVEWNAASNIRADIYNRNRGRVMDVADVLDVDESGDVLRMRYPRGGRQSDGPHDIEVSFDLDGRYNCIVVPAFEFYPPYFSNRLEDPGEIPITLKLRRR